MRSATSILSAGLIGGTLLGAWRARAAVAGHGLLDAGLGQLWRELVRAPLLEGAAAGLALGAGALLLLGLLAALGLSRATRVAALAGAALMASMAGLVTWLLRGRFAPHLKEAPAWAIVGLRTALIVGMLALLLFVVRRVVPWLRDRLASRGASGAGGRAWGALGLATALALGGFEAYVRAQRAEPDPGAPNLLLVTIDTLRADHLGSHGYVRATSPRMDALAAAGVRFERAMSQAPWTLPSMASLHTGRYPSEHGADRGNRRLDRSHLTLAEVLRDGGYHTVGVVSHLFVSDRFGFSQGYARFDEGAIAGHEGLSSRRITRTALELVGERPPEPFFLWTHYFDPHYTYVDHPGHDFADPDSVGLEGRVSFEFLEEHTGELTPDQVAQVIALYDEEIAHTDAAIGALVDGLESLALERGLVTAITADHGELFRERGRFGHGREVWAELVHVPLIVSGPPELVGPARVDARPAEVRALARTLLGLARLEDAARRWGGEDLLAPARGDELAFFEGGYASGADARKLGVLDAGGWKRVHDLDLGTRALFQLVEDPGELRDRSGDPTASAPEAALDDALADWWKRHGAGAGATELDLGVDELEHLRDLGYVE